MKLLALALPFALLATPAAAQSLTDTHKRLWAPAGKMPVVTWHPIGRSACPTASGHHQAGKGQLTLSAPCRQVAGKPESDAALADARAR